MKNCVCHFSPINYFVEIEQQKSSFFNYQKKFHSMFNNTLRVQVKSNSQNSKVKKNIFKTQKYQKTYFKKMKIHNEWIAQKGWNHGNSDERESESQQRVAPCGPPLIRSPFDYSAKNKAIHCVCLCTPLWAYSCEKRRLTFPYHLPLLKKNVYPCVLHFEAGKCAFKQLHNFGTHESSDVKCAFYHLWEFWGRGVSGFHSLNTHLKSPSALALTLYCRDIGIYDNKILPTRNHGQGLSINQGISSLIFLTVTNKVAYNMG